MDLPMWESMSVVKMPNSPQIYLQQMLSFVAREMPMPPDRKLISGENGA
jgi:hypothetical protein